MMKYNLKERDALTVLYKYEDWYLVEHKEVHFITHNCLQHLSMRWRIPVTDEQYAREEYSCIACKVIAPEETIKRLNQVKSLICE